MLDVTVVAIGKFKDKNIITEINEIRKRIGFSLDFVFLKDVKGNNIDEIKKKEFEEIFNFFSKNKRNNKEGYKILLWEKGKEKDTFEFHNFLDKLDKKVFFIITGAFGPSNELLNFVDFKLSLSKMTFTHEISMLLLVEQLYRVYTINKNIPYCK